VAKLAGALLGAPAEEVVPVPSKAPERRLAFARR
jgi:hypothetical protein